MPRRYKLIACAVIVLLLIWAALPIARWRGWGKSDADKQAADAAKTAAQKKEEEKKKKEAPKPDFHISDLRVQPADPDNPLSAAKPGHWLSATRKATANNFDFVGTMDAEISTRLDTESVPLELDHEPYLLRATRNLVLPKGREKYLDQTLFIPRSERKPWVSDRINTRGGAEVLAPVSQELLPMPSYQYYFVVLVREPSRYKSFARKEALKGASWDGNLAYYRVNMPHVDEYVPLPSNPLAWTSTAYVLWDDVDPGVLSLEQQQAMLDWLHWGGQLIISGPDSLTLLHNSFLDPYLPATAGKSRTLTAELLAPLSTAVQPTGNGKDTVSPLDPVRPWSGVELELRPTAYWLPERSQDLVAEGAVGRGRIVVTAFHLTQRDLVNWPGFDSLLNAILLRHPPRQYVATNDLDREWMPQWADRDQNRFDPLLTCGLRYLSRDMAPNGEFVSDRSIPAPQPEQADNSGQPTIYTSFGQPAEQPAQIDDGSIGSGVGGWTDFGGISSAARQSLRTAAGIAIPKPMFVAWMLIAYLVILGPLNWGLFNLIGRVEWAWVAAPFIAITGAVVVTKAAHLNIGFARSQTEIDVVELQPSYPRAHLTRYTALYTSLSTTYDVRFDDPHALVEPFALGGESRLRQDARTVTLHRDADVRLTDFDVSSNSTAMLHSEQMFDFGGGISCATEGGRLKIFNRSKFTIRQAGIVWREPNGDFDAAWIGEFPADSDHMLDFKPVRRGSPALPNLIDPIGASPEPDGQKPDPASTNTPTTQDIRIQPSVGPTQPRQVRADSIADIVTNPEGLSPGEMRLVGSLAESLPGMEVTPAASQATRAAVYVVANLRYAPLPPPQADVNLRPPQNAPPEPPDEPIAPSPNPTP